MTRIFLYLFLISVSLVSCIQKPSTKAKINILSDHGHPLPKGSSGFNVRIADKVWSYSHPDFIAAVDSLQPGWLRYFSGTMGDAFNSATGQYDYDYAWQFDHQGQYLKGHQFVSVKGPHTIYDLYGVLGRVGGGLVVTINGFTETPRIAAELARFCKNNNIKVEAWQFCNEPYFYVPNRGRYWWNDGADYATKMKPFADSILSVLPEAKLALNFTWDGIWGFMKEINQYEQEESRFWNVFSKHSYAPHIGGSETFESAYKRGNTKLLTATSVEAMNQIEEYTWEGAPLLITEFGVWNRALNGIYSAIYNAEYTLRQLEHSNAFLIGSHEVSNKAHPLENKKHLITDSFKNNIKIDTDTIRTGFTLSGEGKAIYLVHQATNDSEFTYTTELKDGPVVLGLKGAQEQGWYARSFRGMGQFDYLIITNRSSETLNVELSVNNTFINKKLSTMYISSDDAKGKASEIQTLDIDARDLEVRPYSVTLVKWLKEEKIAPEKSRIYQSSITEKGVRLSWWKLKNVNKYLLKIKSVGNLTSVELPTNKETYEVTDLVQGADYTFSICGINETGHGEQSNEMTHKFDKPNAPSLFQSARRYRTVTLFWKSVSNASGYLVNQVDENGNIKTYDAKNVFGYRVEDLDYDISYEFSVSAYNGLAISDKSNSLIITCKQDLPIPPRNISAKETLDGVLLQWIIQDTINADVKYRLYRGKSPYTLEPIYEGITGSDYIDQSPDPDETFYSVKSYNSSGETNFFANTATLISRKELLNLDIEKIDKQEEEYRIKVVFENFPTDGDVQYGVAISDVSYLNVEEQRYFAEKVEKGSYVVTIPRSEFRGNDKYAVKAMVITNGAPMYSKPPYHNLSNK